MKSKTYKVVRDESLDFLGETYSDAFPNLHRYPATMIPQLGVALLERFGLIKGRLLDPYCGSGSSFASAIQVGIKSLYGFDLNPLATLITSAKFTRVEPTELREQVLDLAERVVRLKPSQSALRSVPKVTNIDYWFSKDAVCYLANLRILVEKIADEGIRKLVMLAFSETVRDVSYTRRNEFKLYRIPQEKIPRHNPDVREVFLAHLRRISAFYADSYYPKLGRVSCCVSNKSFEGIARPVDVVLTSPPYGDSQTTVAYGQFSTLTNEWLGFAEARSIDSRLMGGRRAQELLKGSIISNQLELMATKNPKRALEVSSFYSDLGDSIGKVSRAVKKGGLAIYIVGNRRVKDLQLVTDQFIAEEFERGGFRHLTTFERVISSKSMPSVNSPSNKAGITRGTMTQEFIVVCQKA